METPARSGSAPSVFLSYARKDLERARKVYEELTQRGLDVWFDQVNLRPGKWKPQILRAIRKSRNFIICLSQAALIQTGDHPGFQDTELNEAYNIAINQDDAQFTIIPVRLENCDRGDNRLSQFQQFDLFSNWVDTLDRLAAFLGGKPLKLTIIGGQTEMEKRVQALQGKIIAFHYAGENEKATPDVKALAQILSDHGQESAARYAAASAMRWARPDAQTVIEPLIRALQDPDDGVRHTAGESLLSLDLENKEGVLPPLLRALENKESSFVRFYAAAAIGRIGPKAQAAVDPLIRALEDQDWKVRRITAEALASIGPEALSAVDPLIRSLQDQRNHEWVRSNCVFSLAAIAPHTEPVMQALSTALNDPSDKVRSAAGRALGIK